MTTLGPYGGALIPGEGGAREQVSAPLAALLTGEGEGPALEAQAHLAPVRVGADGEPCLLHTAGVEALPPFDLGVERGAGLQSLALAARALEHLHERGRCHGDVRPETLRGQGDALRLLTPAQPVDAARLLALRLGAGASPLDTAYAAPEVLAGQKATPASDVYALAALAYHVLAGRPPLGQLGSGPPSSGLPAQHGATLRQALDADPARRPSASLLAATFEAASAAPGERVAAANPQGQQVSAILVLVLLLGGMFVFCGAISLVAMSWDWLGEVGRFAVLFVLTLGIGGGGLFAERRGYERTGFSFVVLGSQLLWADAGYLLYLANAEDEPGPWTLAALVVTCISFLLAVRRSSAVFGILSAGGYLITSLCLGEFLSTGSDVGPPVYLLIVAASYAALTVLAHSLVGIRVAASFALGGIGLGLISGFWGLGVLHDHPLFGIVWPLIVCACFVPAAVRAPKPYDALAALGLLALLGISPTCIALIEHPSLPHLQLAVAIGLGLIAAAFKSPALAHSTGAHLLALTAGLTSVCAAPAFLALDKCGGQAGFDLLNDALKNVGQLHETRFIYLAIVLGISGGLVALGFLFAPQAQRKLGYRLLEGAGLLLGFGVLTILSLLRTQDWSYPLLLFGGGFAVLGLGVVQRRATLAAITVPVLLLNLWIQYFGKLADVIPMQLLMIGFGLGLLGCGVVYERKVKDLLPSLKDWR